MKVLSLFTLFFIAIVFMASSIAVATDANLPMRQVFVSTEHASVWVKPGLTYKNCESAEASASRKADCDSRVFLEAGDEVDIYPTKDGFPDYKIYEVPSGRDKIKKRFYKVQAINKYGKRSEGWISEDQITKVSQEKIIGTEEKEKDVEEGKLCSNPPLHEANDAKGIGKKIKKFQTAVMDKLSLPPRKEDREIDYFLCLHRDERVSHNTFLTQLAKFKKAAKDAEASFKVPYALTMCTILDESGLFFNPDENDEYIGYGQFGSALVEDLSKKINSAPYNQMWTQFQRKNPDARFTDRDIRSSDNPSAAVGAVAMSMRWLYGERLSAAGCKDCSSAHVSHPEVTSLEKINRKDLYMLVAGYNYSPYSLNRMSRRGPTALGRSYPPPRETRNYMKQMDRCLEKGKYESFRNGKKDPLFDVRKAECRL